jgi:hypothetical protein
MQLQFPLCARCPISCYPTLTLVSRNPGFTLTDLNPVGLIPRFLSTESSKLVTYGYELVRILQATPSNIIAHRWHPVTGCLTYNDGAPVSGRHDKLTGRCYVLIRDWCVIFASHRIQINPLQHSANLLQ